MCWVGLGLVLFLFFKVVDCFWGEGVLNLICKRRKCGWEEGESRFLGNWFSYWFTEERGWWDDDSN